MRFFFNCCTHVDKMIKNSAVFALSNFIMSSFYKNRVTTFSIYLFIFYFHDVFLGLSGIPTYSYSILTSNFVFKHVYLTYLHLNFINKILIN